MRGLPLDDSAPSASKFKTKLTSLLAFVLLAAVASVVVRSSLPSWHSTYRTAARDFKRLPVACPTQPPALPPRISFVVPTEEVVKRAYVDRLRGAVRVPTETFDGAPTDGSDAWYDKFYAFEDYLQKTFPDVCVILSSNGQLTWMTAGSPLSN